MKKGCTKIENLQSLTGGMDWEDGFNMLSMLHKFFKAQ